MATHGHFAETTPERVTDFGIVVGIEGGDSSYAVAAVDFASGYPLAYIPVRDLHPQGKFAVNSVVVAEITLDPEDSMGYHPNVKELETVTDEEADYLWSE